MISSGIQRRSFLKTVSGITAASLVTPIFSSCGTGSHPANNSWPPVSNSSPYETIIAINELIKPLSVLQISDSHITFTSDTDKEYEQYSERMAGAYAHTKHYETCEPTTPIDSFMELIAFAQQEKVDLIALTGDIVNFPSATAVSMVMEILTASGIPFVYTAGNHDWHYEGMDGSADGLRREWSENRLKPLYEGGNALYSSRLFGGINIVTIDNSTYQVNDEQLEFYRQQQKRPEFIALFMHIPMYMPTMGICCGHPQWGYDTDRGYEIERRQRWSKNGNQPSTAAFVDQVMNTEKLAGIFVGHWHQIRTITYRGKNQYISGAAYNGQHRMIRFIPV